MKRICWIVLIIINGAAGRAQHIDLNAEVLNWVSGIHHWSGQGLSPEAAYGKAADTLRSTVNVDFKARVIRVQQHGTNKILYDLKYSAVFQGENRNVVLQPHETMFLTNDPEVTLVTYDEQTGTMGFIHNDKRIRLFGRFEPK